MYNKCPHCDKPLPDYVELCRSWLANRKSLKGVKLDMFCEDYGISIVSLRTHHFPKYNTSWTRLLYEERKKRFDTVRDAPAAEQMKALGLSLRQTARWREKL